MSKTNSQFLISITPSRDGVVTALRTMLTDELVLEMAKSDVPIPDEVAANKRALTDIRDSGIVLQRRLVSRLSQLGYQVTLQPLAT